MRLRDVGLKTIFLPVKMKNGEVKGMANPAWANTP
jgi:hypothetical protein